MIVPEVSLNVIGIRISKGNSFTIVDDVKDFLTRSCSYMSDLGYKVDINSNMGRIYFKEDYSGLFTIGHNISNKYPSFTMINMVFCT